MLILFFKKKKKNHIWTCAYFIILFNFFVETRIYAILQDALMNRTLKERNVL